MIWGVSEEVVACNDSSSQDLTAVAPRHHGTVVSPGEGDMGLEAKQKQNEEQESPCLALPAGA